MSEAPLPSLEQSDALADQTIQECLDPEKLRSFFLYAGAGTGKTRSLVNALNHVRNEHSRRFWLRGQRIAVITFTNAARDEIRSRLKFDRLIEVSTIHSFAWSLIDGYNADIREWLRSNLTREIAGLRVQQAKGKPNSQASIDRVRSIESKTNRLAQLDQIRTFAYNPAGDNRGRDSLNHAEVIAMTSFFLSDNSGLQRALIGKFPILLIDESQDTNKSFMEALLKLESLNEGKFCLGLFGDTMQRIYADGKADLGKNLPPSWARPVKQVNYRCPRRVVTLLNKIRAADDGQTQVEAGDSVEGCVRLFVIPSSVKNKSEAEAKVAVRMAAVTADPEWASGRDAIKTLILEHHMAAKRMGFSELFETLYPVERLQTGLLDGSLSGLRLFSTQVAPLVTAMRKGDDFAAAAVVRRHSPLLDRVTLKAAKDEQPKLLKQAHDGAKAAAALWKTSGSPTFGDVLRCISQFGLFDVPEPLRSIATRRANDFVGSEGNETDDDVDVLTAAWTRFLGLPFDQIEGYTQYVAGQAEFDTHQGVKGRQFPFVVVIIDDEEARGFMFSYDKLFGAKPLSKTDMDNVAKGGENTLDRTRRLFYVTCSRTMNSLAIVAYSNNPQAVQATAVGQGWFSPDEIELIS